jgi:uncharacterized protein
MTPRRWPRWGLREFVSRKIQTRRSEKADFALPLSATSKQLMAKSARERIAEFCCFKLRVSPSRIHRLGVFAAEDIPARTRVIEYRGKKLTRRQACEVFRERWTSRSPHLHYLARLDSYWTVDGAVGGSGAEFVNHSCDPNVAMKTIRKRIWVVTLRRIRRGEELLTDYSFDPKGIRVACRCGSPKCRGTLNSN